MSKYLLKFSKKGNIRFISHLDIYRLFCRTVRKTNLDIEYSNGYNPHEKLNLIQPLSLGFESECEYLEIDTKTEHDILELITMFNSSMPEGLEFYDAKRINTECKSITNLSQAAIYNIKIKAKKEDFDKIDIASFLNREEVFILKRDKKTKTMVPKNVKNLIYDLNISDYFVDEFIISCCVKCATNESLNPSNLLNAIFEYSGLDFNNYSNLITRTDILSGEPRCFKSIFSSIF